MASNDMNNPWSTDKNDFPSQGSDAEQLRFLVSFGVLAPSGHNTQPWLFHVDEDYLDLFADRTRALPVVDPRDRELTISCGAALGHLSLAARYFGREPIIDEYPEPTEPDHLARIRLGPEITSNPADAALFGAISQRRTTRQSFDDRMLPDELCDLCVTAATEKEAELVIVTDPNKRARIGGLVAEGDRIQFADPRFRRELAAWIHSRRAASRDGMSAEGFGMPDILSFAGAALIRTFDIGEGIAAGDHEKIVDGSPTLAVLGTTEDGPRDWLRTGQALSRILLTLTAAGATASYLNQPIEVDGLRTRLREAVALRGMPQLLLRFGFGPKLGPTVRRSVEDVLV
jgi:nitroreductase